MYISTLSNEVPVGIWHVFIGQTGCRSCHFGIFTLFLNAILALALFE